MYIFIMLHILFSDYYRFEYGQGLNESLQEQRHFRSKMQFVDIKDQERILIGAMYVCSCII